ncbi:MAG: membrane protein insertase YidC [Clostridia bacterium]|nr:membrane protein insertase YidC [Clostridia bacterium]
MAIFNVINEYILSHVLRFLMGIFSNNFAVAIFVFTLVINLCMIPLTIKSQKSSMQQTRIKPKLDALKEKYGDDKQKYSVAMQDLYTKEKVSMSGGCLPMIVHLVFLMSIYYLVLGPITYLTTVDTATVQELATAMGITVKNNLRLDLDVIAKVTASGFTAPAGFEAQTNEILAAVNQINFNFFGIDLTSVPKFTPNLSKAEINWIIPFLSFAAAMFSSLLSIRTQKKANPSGPSMTGMMLFMPIISLIIAFSAPCGLGFYWACSSFVSAIIQEGVQRFCGPHKMIARERSKEIIKRYELEKKSLDSVKD